MISECHNRYYDILRLEMQIYGVIVCFVSQWIEIKQVICILYIIPELSIMIMYYYLLILLFLNCPIFTPTRTLYVIYSFIFRNILRTK